MSTVRPYIIDQNFLTPFMGNYRFIPEEQKKFYNGNCTHCMRVKALVFKLFKFNRASRKMSSRKGTPKNVATGGRFTGTGLALEYSGVCGYTGTNFGCLSQTMTHNAKI